ncbi:MarR family winged helix-turn-helix transcriptional regulator [Limoniibacter endophyticus]|uniref:Transcriptional regulator n=1 Tax=Limoniibacter endophyticus TaxID=1565040 RepID=A0A8J3DNF7_9HYPH|nr:MarR family winged helix-turn-helix transcriptional regulator [Limoniibacter endophyticus]GHC73898.1 transcriptional regulator [Limoniibacter endophyticus]
MNKTVNTDSIGFVISDVARLMRTAFEREVADAGFGLTKGEARTLVHAARAGSVRQNVLAERMSLEPMTLCAYLDRLEARGLITRSVDPDDRRAKRVELTNAAEEVLRRTRKVSDILRITASKGFTPEEWDDFFEKMKRVRDNFCEKKST